MIKSSKIRSQKSKSIVVYAVHYGDWAIDEKNNPIWKKGDPLIEAVPSTSEIDDRTCQAKMFNSKREAIKFAKNYIKQNDSKWLAYVEIKKCNVEIIQKLK